jgi:putative transposase
MLKGPRRGVWYHLYVMIDIFSRYAVGWELATSEDSLLAEDMIARAAGRFGVPDALHADRGTSMTSKPVTQLLMDLGVERSHSRPRVSNDNPYSEAHFKTLKYAPIFPDHFESIDHARAFITHFMNYYNQEHRHSGIGLHTPASVHFGTAQQIRRQRQQTLDAAFTAHPARFGTRSPIAPRLPKVAWINEPQVQTLLQSA